jgi:serine/threonine protein kinase
VDNYRIERMLSVGAQGITYLATDLKLNVPVALREYLPIGLAARGARGLIVPLDDEDGGEYADAVQRFCKGAQSFGRARHHNLIRIVRLFEALGSAFLVSEYETGESLPAWVARHGLPNRDLLLQWIGSLADALATIHAQQLAHKGVQPGRIMVRADNSLVLLDFGVIDTQAQNPFVATSTYVTPGFSAFEQYWQSGPVGPWSDLYSLAATGYWLITGTALPEAPARASGVSHLALSQHPNAQRHHPALVAAVTQGIALHHNDRQIGLHTWRNTFMPAQAAATASASYQYTAQTTAQTNPAIPPNLLTPSVTTTTAPAVSITAPATKAILNAHLLKTAEETLSSHIGAMARIVIKRAANEAPSTEAFIRILGAEIESPEAAQAFMSKLKSVA